MSQAEDDNDLRFARSEPLHLARMLSVDPMTPEPLNPDELATILRHQLGAPIALDLALAEPANSVEPAVPADSDANPEGAITYRDLFAQAQPRLELLQRVKQFAKQCKSMTDGPLPPAVATALYFAAIVKAQKAWNVRISALSAEQVADGVRWTLEQAWVPRELRDLLGN